MDVAKNVFCSLVTLFLISYELVVVVAGSTAADEIAAAAAVHQPSNMNCDAVRRTT